MANETGVANAQNTIGQLTAQLAAARKEFAQAAAGRDIARNAVQQAESATRSLGQKLVAAQGTPAYDTILREYNQSAATLERLKSSQAAFQQQVNNAAKTIDTLNGQLAQAQSDLSAAQSATANTTGTTATSVDNKPDDPSEIPDYTNDTPAPPLTGVAAINEAVAAGRLTSFGTTVTDANGIRTTTEYFGPTTSTPETVDAAANGAPQTSRPIDDTERQAFLDANLAEQQGDPDQSAAETARLQRQGITKELRDTQSSATRQDVENANARQDWRVRISLASSANYFYRAEGEEGILYPLKATDGVIFPYTPTISVTYSATYDQQPLTHSNYKTTQYQSSSVDSISISCDFTAQDTYEANYLLATIHFFRSLTKMFYGQDENPRRGTPPPLCYLYGYGDFQFDKHPMAITGFTYSLPNDVDYIRCDTSSFVAGQPLFNNRKSNNYSPQEARGAPTNLTKNVAPSPFKSTQVQPTYVPTRISLSISAIPVISRYDSSNIFSLKDYASGRLLQGSKQKYGGFW